MRTLKDYCLHENKAFLLEQWDPDNMELSPENVTHRSSRYALWRCSQGHQWQAQIRCRTERDTGCPVCAGKRAEPGFNDLASRRPELAAQWASELNGNLTPDMVTCGTNRLVWWLCSDCGYAWQAKVKSRTEGAGCPLCANKVVVPGKNDLGTLYPDLSGQWHSTRNGKLTPQDVTPGSVKKVWWQCELGHQWSSCISTRVKGAGCPVCKGRQVLVGENDLASDYPKLVSQWHPEKNESLQPSMVTSQSNRAVWWRCSLGHEWKATISSRTVRHAGCPYCANRKVLKGFNDLESLEPEISAQWHPTKNLPLLPSEVTCGSSKRVWWRCALGHEWKAVISSRAASQRCGCPECAGRRRDGSKRVKMHYIQKNSTAD